MKHTVELDTLKIVDRIDNAKRQVRLARIAIVGIGHLNDSDEETGPIEALLGEIEDELEEISDEVHPPMTKKAFAAQKAAQNREWKAELRSGQASPEAMRQISKDRRDGKIEAELERANGTAEVTS